MDLTRAAQTEKNQGWQHCDPITPRVDSNGKIPEQMCSFPALPSFQPRNCSPPALSTMAHGPSLQEPPTGLIPCEVDWHSGSFNQSEKRKANSDASQRFRQRKNRLQAEVDRLKEENLSLRRQLAYYQSECDYFRSHSYLSGESRPPPPV